MARDPITYVGGPINLRFSIIYYEGNKFLPSGHATPNGGESYWIDELN